MKQWRVPARYAAEIESSVRRAVETIASDAKLRDGEQPFARGFIPEFMLDHTQSGELLITIEKVKA